MLKSFSGFFLQRERELLLVDLGFPGGRVGKNLPANAGGTGSIPGAGRSPGEGSGNPLQYSCLENSMDGGAWWAKVHGVAKSRTVAYLFQCHKYEH